MNTLTLQPERSNTKTNTHFKRQWQSFLAALSLEGLVVLALVAWLAAHPNVVPERVTPLSIDPTMPEKLESTPPPEKITLPPLPATPIPKPQRSAQAPAPIPTPQPVLTSSPTTSPEPVAPVLTPSPMAVVKSAPPLPPPIAQPATPAIDPAIAYNAKLAAAVQAAFEVPSTAAALNFKGRTRVEFNLLDGVVSAIRVVQPSGLGATDRAAIKAVQMAAFPPPPPALQGKSGIYQIWVACL